MSDRRGKYRYSKVSRRIWRDEKVRRLSKPKPNGQSLFVWLLTCSEQTVIPGLIALGEAGMAEALEWDLEGFRKAFAEVFREGLAVADWEARLVWVVNGIRHNEPASPNVIRSWANDWDELPECALKAKANEHLKAYAKAKGKAWLEAFDKACPKPCGNQDQDQDQDQDKARRACATPAREARDALPDPTAQKLLDVLERHGELAELNLVDIAERIAGKRMAKPIPFEWSVAAIERVADIQAGKAAGHEPMPMHALGSYLMQALSSPSAPREAPKTRGRRGRPAPYVQTDSRTVEEMLEQTLAPVEETTPGFEPLKDPCEDNHDDDERPARTG